MRMCAPADARQAAAPESASDAGSSGQASEVRGSSAPAPEGSGCAARALAADAAVLKLCAFGPSIRAHHSQPWRQDGGSLCYNRARPASLQPRGRSRIGLGCIMFAGHASLRMRYALLRLVVWAPCVECRPPPYLQASAGVQMEWGLSKHVPAERLHIYHKLLLCTCSPGGPDEPEGRRDGG